MGQKVNPIGFRLPVTKDWKSRWFARKAQFGPLLQEDLKIRAHLQRELQQAAVSKIQIERFGHRVRITIFTGRPGVILSGRFSTPGGSTRRGGAPDQERGTKRGAGIDIIKSSLAGITGDKEVLIEIKEIRQAEVDAQLVAENIAQQLVRRVAFRRAMKRSIQTAMQLGAEGIKVRCSGRLGGADLARSEQYKDGKVPLHTLRANIDYGFAEAQTLAGLIGIKVWICKPQNWEDTKHGHDAKTRKAPKGAARRPRGNRDQQQQA